MKIFSEDVIKVGNLLYLFGTDLNILYSINLDDGNFSFIGKIPEEHVLKRRQIAKIMYWDSKLYLVPLSAKKLWIYSLINKKWASIEIDDYENNWAKSYFRNAVIHKNKMLIVGGYYPAILVLDLETYKIKYIKKPFWEKKKVRCSDLFFRGDPLKKEELIYLASSIDNTVLVFNVENDTYQWVKVGSERNRYSGIEWDGNNFWLASRIEAKVIKWDEKDTAVEYNCEDDIDFSNGKIIGIVKGKDGYIVPFRGKKANSLFVTENGEVYSDKRRYIFYKRIDDEYIFQCADGKIHYIDYAGIEKVYENNFDEEEFVLSLKEYDEKFYKNLENIYYEDEPFTLRGWIYGLI